MRVLSFTLAALLVAAVAAPVGATEEEAILNTWQRASLAELRARRGGLRVGGREFSIALAVSESLDGSPVLVSRFELAQSGRGVAWTGVDAREVVQAVDGSGSTVFEHDVSPDGVRLVLENSANGVWIQRELGLQIRVPGAPSRGGSHAQPAGRWVQSLRQLEWPGR